MSNPYEPDPVKKALRRALHLISASCKGQGNGDKWIERILDTWSSEMSHATPEAIDEAARKWIRSETFRPALSDMLALLRTEHTGSAPSEVDACDDCSGTGWRTMASHGIDMMGRRKVRVINSPCDCPRGARMAMHIDGGWGWRQAAAQERNRRGFLELHITDRDLPVLLLEQRLTPEDYQRHQQLARRRNFEMPGA